MVTFSTSPLVGPGSQPADEDGSVLDYMQMPSGMMTFSAPDLPEPEDAAGLDAAMAVLDEALARLNGYERDGIHNILDISNLDEANAAFIRQVLGEGEVSVIGGGDVQAQESVLAGVWAVHLSSETGAPRHLIEIGSFPTTVAALAFRDAAGAVEPPAVSIENVFNAPALLSEINEYTPKAAPGRPPHVINLSLLPHTEQDLDLLDKALGRGQVTILSRGYGNCRVTATASRNVWWVQFYNSQETLILNSIEITTLPEVVCASPEDIADSAERLSEILEVYR